MNQIFSESYGMDKIDQDKQKNGITHVSDTALWVAVHRGREGQRPDAMYKDPLALKLAGARGDRIAKKMAFAPFMEWMMSLRTMAIDTLISDAVQLGVTTIVNLGAGLDTRPYRLSFPQGISWLEVDFPHMINYKNSFLNHVRPNVPLERHAVDLSDRVAARAFYQTLRSLDGTILVITEGVIPYLDNEQVANLADDLLAIPNIKYWIQDFRQGGFSSSSGWWLKFKMRFAPFKFSVQDWFQFFKEHGWKPYKKILILDMADLKGRKMPSMGGMGFLGWILPKKMMEKVNRSIAQAIGFAIFERLDSR
jgi:methyltransferase (TIGR00027 family)